MNIDQYFSASCDIHKQIADIANATMVMAKSGCANPQNKMFVDLMKSHSNLVAQFQELHREFVKTNPNYAT